MDQVYILVYAGKQGTSTTVYATDKLAQQAAIDIVEQNRADFEIPDTISDEDAFYDWHTLTGWSESLYVDSYTIITEI